MSYEDKYLKYKNKYLSLKYVSNFSQIGGSSGGAGGAGSAGGSPRAGGSPSGFLAPRDSSGSASRGGAGPLSFLAPRVSPGGGGGSAGGAGASLSPRAVSGAGASLSPRVAGGAGSGASPRAAGASSSPRAAATKAEIIAKQANGDGWEDHEGYNFYREQAAFRDYVKNKYLDAATWPQNKFWSQSWAKYMDTATWTEADWDIYKKSWDAAVTVALRNDGNWCSRHPNSNCDGSCEYYNRAY